MSEHEVRKELRGASNVDMVEQVFPFPSSRLGGAHKENAILDVLYSFKGTEKSGSGGHERQMGGLESRDVPRQSGRAGDYGGRNYLNSYRDEIATGDDPWVQHGASVKQTTTQRQPGLDDMGGDFAGDVLGRDNIGSPGIATQRAHSERLQMVGAVDKTEMRGGVADQELGARVSVAMEGRTPWDFSNLPTSSAAVFLKRSMTVHEVRRIQSIGQAVICTDLDGNITYWNRAAEGLYLWKAEEVLGQNVLNLLASKNLKKDTLEVIERVSLGESWTGPFPAVRKDGVVISTVVTDTPIVDTNNKIIGILGVSFDASSLPPENSTIRRTTSDEGLVSEGEKDKEIIQETGWDDGKNMLSWRRVHRESEDNGDDSLPDPKSTADGAGGSNFLTIGRSSVQQLLRKLTIGSGHRERDFTRQKSDRESPREEFIESRLRGGSPQQPERTFEHLHTFSNYVPNESTQTDSLEADGSSLLSVILAKHQQHQQQQSGRGGEGFESFDGSEQEDVKEGILNSLVVPRMGQPLSRSSSGSAPGSATAPYASSAGSPPFERNAPDYVSKDPGPALDFLQAGEDFQLQLALALRVASVAAVIDDPDLSANLRGPMGNTRLMPGVSKVEATAYRYWVSSCLGYEDRIEDGFYEIWGMSPYVWSMCTDSSEVGRMPPLEHLRAVLPKDASFEVVLVDRNTDPTLSELEDKAVGLAYESTDVLEMASELSKMVAKVMGGPVESNEVLAEAWEAAFNKLTDVLGTVVLPIGLLRVGLSRHRALLFKVLADSVGLACRFVRGSAFGGKEDEASVVVKVSGDDREWMIDLLVNPGTRLAPDKRLAAPAIVLPSPLQFQRMNPFGGSSVSVAHWSRGESNGEPRSRDRADNAVESPARRKFSDPIRNFGSPKKINSGERSPPVASQGLGFSQAEGSQGGNNKGKALTVTSQGLGFSQAEGSQGGNKQGKGLTVASPRLDFSQAEGSQGGNNKGKGLSEDKEKYGLVNRLDRRPLGGGQADPKVRSPDVGDGNFFLENVPKGKDGNNNNNQRIGSDSRRSAESPRGDEAAREYDKLWAREGRRGTGSDDSGRGGLGDANRMLEQISSESSDFEIAWEDVEKGERIGQGSYGMVYRADWQGSDVAVKVFLDQDLKTEALEEFKSEVGMMRRLRHPNIVLFMGAVTKPPNLSIITEFCPRGSLYRLLHRPNRELDDRKRIRMAIDVAKGMNYLHRCQPPVVHRDLKSPNLLVDKNWTVKVADFGLSRQKHSTFLSSKSSAGTPEWMAPEVLRNEPSDEKSDVYSFGVIMWELVTLKIPWSGMNPIQVVGAVGFQHRRLVIPDTVDRHIAAIIQACWRTDTRLRPSFADLMHDLKALQQRPQPLGQRSTGGNEGEGND